MRRTTIVLGAIAPMLGLAAANADWSDNFDSYAAGTDLHGVGGWEGWFGDPGATAFVTDAISFSGPNSVDINGGADLVQQLHTGPGGLWSLTAMQYVPDGYTGQTYFIVLDDYDTGGVGSWSTQVYFQDGLVTSTQTGASTPMIFGEWVELRLDVDLDASMQTFYYGGTEVYTTSWGVTNNIGALDLFANGASSVYYDDIALTLIPAPGVGALLALGLVARRRRD
jgi:hypothetical protein